ncbi:GIY-YIG nuclease family protein [Natrinema saccharevitans]|uniref:GIY-YIG nuclease family protein n=1 Tax=Natrinema saccharevitans TaxID=301967 RepID=UPI001FE32BAE|nr:DUF123 domain-containing protein [Natrinema saccharevitans]
MIEATRAATIEVGALGDLAFEAGAYAYVGSAFGPGGFSRVDRRRSKAPTRSHSLRSRDRHRELAAGDRETRHWHVDYLLGHPATRLETAITFPDADRECELATALPGEPVEGVGASDCDCPAHLLAATDTTAIRTAAVDAGGVVDE